MLIEKVHFDDDDDDDDDNDNDDNVRVAFNCHPFHSKNKPLIGFRNQLTNAICCDV